MARAANRSQNLITPSNVRTQEARVCRCLSFFEASPTCSPRQPLQREDSAIPLLLPASLDSPGHALLGCQANLAYQHHSHGVGNSIPTRRPWPPSPAFTNPQRRRHDSPRSRPRPQYLAQPAQCAAAVSVRPISTNQPESRQTSPRTTRPASRVAAKQVTAAVEPVFALHAADYGRLRRS
jgi:hypothetical protein